jgi:hypothetical protein
VAGNRTAEDLSQAQSTYQAVVFNIIIIISPQLIKKKGFIFV